jgi:hypothetical protein
VEHAGRAPLDRHTVCTLQLQLAAFRCSSTIYTAPRRADGHADARAYTARAAGQPVAERGPRVPWRALVSRVEGRPAIC